MDRPILPVAVLALLTFCSPDRNRQASDTGMGGATAGGLSSNDTMPTGGADSAAPAGHATPSPAGILSQLSVANTAEIRLAGTVAKQATSPQVKQVARKLAADHAKNLEQLRALAQKLSLSLTSPQGGASPDTTALPPDLQGKSGTELDRAFVQHEIQEHQANIEKIRSQMIPAAQDEQIKTYLQKTVTEMEGHLAALQRAQQQLGA
jgi:predicted outer membrane protein